MVCFYIKIILLLLFIITILSYAEMIKFFKEIQALILNLCSNLCNLGYYYVSVWNALYYKTHNNC